VQIALERHNPTSSPCASRFSASRRKANGSLVMASEESDERCGWPRTPLASCRTYRLRTPFQLVHLYAERGSPKYEKAARRWLVRYLTEGTPTLKDVSKVTASSRFGSRLVPLPTLSRIERRQGPAQRAPRSQSWRRTGQLLVN
jgi:hypothetical protein